MMSIRHAISVVGVGVLFVAGQPLAAQFDEEYLPPAELGTAISIPKPPEDQVDETRYTSPELPDTRPAVGSQLVDGRLPRPRLDYAIITPKSLQRLSFFDRGLVVLHMKAGAANLRKRMILPEAAIEEYLRVMTPDDAARIAREERLLTALSNDRGFIRVYREDGTHAQVEFSNSRILPATVQQFRSILDDLVRILAEDRGATNPLVDYSPRLGDKLISEDMKLWEVTAFAGDGSIVELTGLQQPVRIFVSKDEIPSYFNAILSRKPN
jgi:hypothetical protein